MSVEIDVAKIRASLGMSQPQFAVEFGLDLNTVRSWEQRRRRPSGCARVLLMVIKNDPKAVRQALRAA